MATMRAVQVSRPGGPLEIVERPVPEPPARSVRIRVQACGICHSDSLTKDGTWPGVRHPRLPGHEIAGVIDAVGPDTPRLEVGQRVGVGWSGGYCGHCDPCRRGVPISCVTQQITGITRDGGYGDFLIAAENAVAVFPADLPAVDAAPLMCAGLTTYNALRHSGARAGDRVAVLGIGGLGHLGVQYAAKMGFRTVAIARGADKKPLAQELGAVDYIDSQAQDPAAVLAKMGGAKVILATATSGEAMAAVQGGLALDGTLLIVGAAHSLNANPLLLLGGRRSIRGWASGTSIDIEDTLAFSALVGVRSRNEVYPLEKAPEAYERMMSGKARFRVVLDLQPRSGSR
jgi:D-arabinose 1-dehydrogenase-like Zn-dependent alcohol dehydrogenase